MTALVVLVVEDNPFVGSMTSRFLHRMGHRPTWDASPLVAMTRLLRGALFDFVLCDVSMPSMNGLEFTDSALRADPGLAGRIVAMTGGALSEIHSGFARRRVPVLDKPFEIHRLEALLVATTPRA